MSEDLRIQDALKRFGFQVTTTNCTEQQIRMTLRVPVNAAEQWKVCMFSLLRYTKGGTSWSVDPSRKYFIRGDPPNERLFYIWRLIFQGPQIKDAVAEIVHVLTHTPRAKTEVREIALAGARMSPSRGKGATSIAGDEGMPAIAQMALSRLRGG